MRKRNAARRLALALAALVAVAPARAAVDDGLLEARVASFENGVGAAVTFRNFHTLFHTERVPAGPNPWELERTPVDLSVLRYEFDGGSYDLAHFLEHNRTNALLVLKDGKIVQEIYRNGANEESRFISFSVGKSLTSSLLGLALAQGALPSLDAPVTTYVPKLKGTGYDGASVRDLMQMSSGVHMNEDYDIYSEEPNLFAEGIYQSWFTEALLRLCGHADRAVPVDGLQLQHLRYAGAGVGAGGGDGAALQRLPWETLQAPRHGIGLAHDQRALEMTRKPWPGAAIS